MQDPAFEGAQGLCLDMDNKEAWPHVTHSKTGMHNVRQLWKGEFETYYVSRTYFTRHGAGPLPGEIQSYRTPTKRTRHTPTKVICGSRLSVEAS